MNLHEKLQLQVLTTLHQSPDLHMRSHSGNLNYVFFAAQHRLLQFLLVAGLAEGTSLLQGFAEVVQASSLLKHAVEGLSSNLQARLHMVVGALEVSSDHLIDLDAWMQR